MASKPCVCIHVTAGLDQLELVLLSEDGSQIQHAASINCNLYDATSRRIQQPEELANAIKQVFVTAKIPMGSLPTVLILPSYFSKHMTLTSNLSAEDINMVLLSEVESHYIFKNQEPIVDWVKLSDQNVLYSAYMRDDIDHWINAFQELRIPLITIDTGFFAALRGLMATGALQSVMEHERPWLLVILSDSSCQLGLFHGHNLRQAEEIPLGTEDTELAIQDIIQDIYRLLENQMVDQITLINNTLRINLALIKDGLNLDIPTIDIVQNKHTIQSLGSVKDTTQYPCTLEALGGVLTPQFGYLAQLNYAPKQGRNLLEADNAKEKTLRGLIIANVIAAVLCAIIWGGLQGMIFIKNQQIQVNGDPQTGRGGPMGLRGAPAKGIGMEAVKDPNAVLDENTAYKKLLAKALFERNTWVNNLLIALGRDLPDDAWIKDVTITNVPVEAKTIATITGQTQSTEPMNTFQETLTKLFEKNAPSLVSIDADADSSSIYHWKLGLNLADNKTGDGKTDAAKAGGPPQ